MALERYGLSLILLAAAMTGREPSRTDRCQPAAQVPADSSGKREPRHSLAYPMVGCDTMGMFMIVAALKAAVA